MALKCEGCGQGVVKDHANEYNPAVALLPRER